MTGARAMRRCIPASHRRMASRIAGQDRRTGRAPRCRRLCAPGTADCAGSGRLRVQGAAGYACGVRCVEPRR
jgi:hypothetical protein